MSLQKGATNMSAPEEKLTSKELIEKLIRHCYNQLTLYRFNKTSLQVSDKYREGRLSVLEYINNLTFYYLQEEKRIKQNFRDQILEQLRSNACLGDSDYKKGPYGALNNVLDEIIVLNEHNS